MISSEWRLLCAQLNVFWILPPWPSWHAVIAALKGDHQPVTTEIEQT